MDEVIRLSGVGFAYDSGEDVLTDVDLSVKRGDFLTIVGPNGGGKTTLVKIILGLLAPRAGQVRVLGGTPRQARRRMGYVPQHAHVQTRLPITALQVALMGARGHGPRWPGYSRAECDQAMAALERVEMTAHADKTYHALSGGQRQRVLVARALASEPELLVFDEPTANIDPKGKVCLFDLLDKLRDRITVVMVSHDLISASVDVTSLAAVNGKLIQAGELTPAMLELIYGIHHASCPMDGYMKELAEVLRKQGAENGHA